MKHSLAWMAGAILASVTAGPALSQDKSVTIVLPEELDIVDPCEASRSNVGRVLLQNVAETMTELKPDEGLKPRLAESWEDRGNGTWRFKLREGVKFHDGTALDAGDVKHSMERAIANPAIVCEIGAKFFGGMTVTEEVVDDTTIDITTDPAQPILPLLMSTMTVVPSEAPSDKFIEKPIGTGPYKFVEYRRGQDIKLERNADYWGEQPAVEAATYVFRTESAVRAAMVATGEADIAPTIANQDATDPKMDFAYPNSETVYLRIDQQIPPLDDKRVRQALNYAVDREAFIGTIMPEGTELSTAIVPPTTLGHNGDLKPYEYDVEKAKSLLEEAKADGVAVDTEITLIGRIANFPNVLETNEALLAMFQEAGFNMKLEMYEVAEWVDLYSQPFAEDRGPQLVEAMHDNANGDPVFSMFFKYASEGLQSATRSPEIDAAIADATTATGDAREEKWSALFKTLHEDLVPDVQLFHMVGFSRVSPRLDFKPTIRTNSELQLSQIAFN